MAMLCGLPAEIQYPIFMQLSAKQLQEAVLVCRTIKNTFTSDSFLSEYAKKYPHTEYFQSPLSTIGPLNAPKKPLAPFYHTLACVQKAENFLPITAKVLTVGQSAEVHGWRVKYFALEQRQNLCRLAIDCPNESIEAQECDVGSKCGVVYPGVGRGLGLANRQPYDAVTFIVLGALLVFWVCDPSQKRVEYRIFNPLAASNLKWKKIPYDRVTRLTSFVDELWLRMRENGTFEVLARDPALPPNRRVAYDLAQGGFYTQGAVFPHWAFQ